MNPEMTALPLVLMYHSVQDYRSDPYQVTVHPRRFDRQLRWLHRRGRRGVSMAELFAARRDGRAAGLVGLTFDDGYTDFVTEVLPALRRYGFGATVFVVAGELGGRNSWDRPGPDKPLMTEGHVRQAVDAGIEIGSHGLRHVRLSDLTEDGLVEQVRQSRVMLRELTGREVPGFCYPYGRVGEREVQAVRAAGYQYACAVRPAPELAGLHAVPRAFIGDRDTSPRLFAKVLRHRLTAVRVASERVAVS